MPVTTLRLNCLVRNSPLIGHLTLQLRLTAARLLSTGKDPKFKAVYNQLRKDGIEIDIQTAGLLYAQAFDLHNPSYSNQAQLDAVTGKTYDRIVKATHTLLKTKEIQGDSPAVSVAAALVELTNPRVGSLSSVQKTMQDRLLKWAKNRLQIRGIQVAKKPYEDIIREALQLEISQPLSGTPPINAWGMMATAQDLQNQLKEEFSDLINAPRVPGSPYDAALLQQYANTLSNLPYTLMLSTSEVKQAIRGVLMDSGYVKQIKTLAGPKDTIDWNKVFRDSPDFRALVSQVFSAKGFSPAQIARIQDSIEQDYRDLVDAKRIAKLEERNNQAITIRDVETKTATERLFELYDLGVFNAARKDALMRLLGVDALDMSTIRHIEDVLRLTKAAFQTPMTQWSPTYNKMLRRVIEREVYKMESGGVSALRVIRALSYIEQINAGAIISNYQNIFQNVGSAMVEGFATMIQDPKRAAEAVKVFTNVFTEVTSGGVREGINKSNVYDVRGSVEDIFNFATAKNTKEFLGAAAAQLTRTALSATDSGAKASLIHMNIARTAVGLLVKANTVNGVQKLSNADAALVVNELLYNNLSAINGMASTLADTMSAIGETRSKRLVKNRFAHELAISNLLTGGNVFNHVIQQLINDGKLSPGSSLNDFVGLNEKTLRALQAAANTAAARGLGHESDFSFMRNTIDKWHLGFAEKINNIRTKKGISPSRRRSQQAREEAAALTFAKLMRFMGGQLRWVALTAARSNFIPLLTEIGIRGGITTYNKLLNKDVAGGIDQFFLENVEFDPNDEKGTEEALAFHLSLRARLARELVGSIMSYFIGYQLILPYMLEKFKEEFPDDDEKESTKKAFGRLSEWINEDPARKRWVMMAAPLAIHIYMDKLIQGSYGDFKARPESQLVEPVLADMFDPGFAGRAVMVQYQPASFVTMFQDLQKEAKKSNPDFAKIGYKQIADFFNIFGFDKMLNTNHNAIVSAEAMGEVFLPDEMTAGWDKAKTTKLNAFQKELSEPDGFIEKVMQGAFGRDTYLKLTGKKEDVERIAPVDSRIIEDWKDTGDVDLLPPEPSTRVEFTKGGSKYKFDFDLQSQKQFVDELFAAYQAKTKEKLDDRPDWDTYTLDRKKRLVDKWYKDVREDLKKSWMKRFPIDGPNADQYWIVEKAE